MEIENKNEHKVIHFSVFQFIWSVLGCFLCFITERRLVKNCNELNLVNRTTTQYFIAKRNKPKNVYYPITVQCIQGVTGGMYQTSGDCSLGHTIPI